MSNDLKCECFMYTLEYPKLTLNVKKEELKTYNYVLMQFILDEFFQKGFVARRINKATGRGTKVKFDKIKDYEKDKKRLFEIARELDVKLEEKK